MLGYHSKSGKERWIPLMCISAEFNGKLQVWGLILWLSRVWRESFPGFWRLLSKVREEGKSSHGLWIGVQSRWVYYFRVYTGDLSSLGIWEYALDLVFSFGRLWSVCVQRFLEALGCFADWDVVGWDWFDTGWDDSNDYAGDVHMFLRERLRDSC